MWSCAIHKMGHYDLWKQYNVLPSVVKVERRYASVKGLKVYTIAHCCFPSNKKMFEWKCKKVVTREGG